MVKVIISSTCSAIRLKYGEALAPGVTFQSLNDEWREQNTATHFKFRIFMKNKITVHVKHLKTTTVYWILHVLAPPLLSNVMTGTQGLR